MGGKEVGGLDQGGLRVHHVDAGIVAFIVSHDQTGIRMSAKALQHGGQGAGATLAPHPAQLASLVSFIWVSICVPPLPSAVLRLIDRFIARWGYPDDLFRLFRGHGGGNLALPTHTGAAAAAQIPGHRHGPGGKALGFTELLAADRTEVGVKRCNVCHLVKVRVYSPSCSSAWT